MTHHPLLQPSGRLVTKFGSRGSELDQLAGPHYAATNSLGNIIVSDFHNHNIKVATTTTTTDELSYSYNTRAGVLKGRSLHIQLRI